MHAIRHDRRKKTAVPIGKLRLAAASSALNVKVTACDLAAW
jgi:hypothetical protein